MPRLSGMNPILLKTLIQLAASNKKPAPSGTVGSDAQLKNRIVLFADEAVALPDWGISGLPSMILGAAPQTCLFVSDLTVDDDGEDKDDPGSSDSSNDDTSDASASGSVSFSLTIKAPPAADSSLKSRTIVWKLTLPVAGFRDVQTGASTPPVHAPVIKTRIKLGGVIRDVEIGLLEMGPLDQPLLIGKDTLSNKFLIRPDRPEDQKTPAAPTVDLTPAPAETPKPGTTPAPETSDAAQAEAQEQANSEAEAEPSDTAKPAPDSQQSQDDTQSLDAPQTTTSQDTQAAATDDDGKTADADPAQANTDQATPTQNQPSSEDSDKTENTVDADPNDSSSKPEQDTTTPAAPATPDTPSAPEPAATNADAPKTQPAEQENNSA
ncbi:hypothetical protein [Thalassospira tepidiphila]|uniref:Uncharacterized protein n=2 Tax=Thalassospira tepidiphila TaxID=393657 RepID=A0A853L033_9PROT|nr:hypothetical protein [Thalassospira tepidiphila]NJB74793.1 hypothetical protein [Thalassospira tepidiphila]OAZ10199.1 hypothetical protein TH4_08065 [Thalassospira tepidiphila MCCC 1A03514]